MAHYSPRIPDRSCPLCPINLFPLENFSHDSFSFGFPESRGIYPRLCRMLQRNKHDTRHKTGVVIGVWALFGQRILVPRLLSISPADSDAAPLFARRSEWGGRRDEIERRGAWLAGHGQGINFHTGSPAHGQREGEGPTHSTPLPEGETDGQIREEGR